MLKAMLKSKLSILLSPYGLALIYEELARKFMSIHATDFLWTIVLITLWITPVLNLCCNNSWIGAKPNRNNSYINLVIDMTKVWMLTI